MREVVDFIHWLKPLLCDDCGKQLGFIAECDNQSSFFCDMCVADARQVTDPAPADSLAMPAEDFVEKYMKPAFFPETEKE